MRRLPQATDGQWGCPRLLPSSVPALVSTVPLPPPWNWKLEEDLEQDRRVRSQSVLENRGRIWPNPFSAPFEPLWVWAAQEQLQNLRLVCPSYNQSMGNLFQTHGARETCRFTCRCIVRMWKAFEMANGGVGNSSLCVCVCGGEESGSQSQPRQVRSCRCASEDLQKDFLNYTLAENDQHFQAQLAF